MILEKKVMAPNESKLAQAVFIHEQLLIAILPLPEEKIEKIQRKATLSVAQYYQKKRSEHSACHNLIQLEFSFFVLVLHHGC